MPYYLVSGSFAVPPFEGTTGEEVADACVRRCAPDGEHQPVQLAASNTLLPETRPTCYGRTWPADITYRKLYAAIFESSQ